MFILNQTNSIGNQFLSEIRALDLQKDRLRFRRNLERLGEIMAYEVSKSLDYHTKVITTPLQKTELQLIKEQPVLLSVLRAAIPFYQGFLNYFDNADSGFVGAYRKPPNFSDPNDFEIGYYYQATPSLENKDVILIDPMLATGKSFVTCIENLLKNGVPRKIHIVSIIGAPEGIQHIQDSLKIPIEIWLCALDEKLNDHAYIVPGLGDAGDLAFGNKI
jgi:uracil phosphoribosyltransferase